MIQEKQDNNQLCSMFTASWLKLYPKLLKWWSLIRTCKLIFVMMPISIRKYPRKMSKDLSQARHRTSSTSHSAYPLLYILQDNPICVWNWASYSTHLSQVWSSHKLKTSKTRVLETVIKVYPED